MIGSGYVLVGDDSFTSSAHEGHYYEWLAPVGEEDWIYLTAISVVEDQIVVAEAAGRFDLYEKRRRALVDALSTLAIEAP
ncbi:MAG: hypothetical protein E4H09_00790 [Spirochaetales bacterium]|nr:MAG: hypothetical protein E4H09_00790 [Spirochaetales bacterium]